MLEVKVKGPAIKLQGQWKFKGETASITQEEYSENAKYLELIKGKVKNSQNTTLKTQKVDNSNNIENKDDKEDKELEVLREKAKDLGIKGAHSMKKENLIAKIEELEKADNSDDSENEEDTPESGVTQK